MTPRTRKYFLRKTIIKKFNFYKDIIELFKCQLLINKPVPQYPRGSFEVTPTGYLNGELLKESYILKTNLPVLDFPKPTPVIQIEGLKPLSVGTNLKTGEEVFGYLIDKDDKIIGRL